MAAKRTLASIFIGLVVALAACNVAAESEMSAAGKSASAAFHDDRVVALLRSVRDGDEQKARKLVAGGADVNASGYEGVTPLIWMMFHHDDRAIALLLDLGANPNQRMGEEGESPVWFASGSGNLKLLRLLLDRGGDPNSPVREQSAMMIAITERHLDCAQLLLDRGADINYHDGFHSTIDAPLIVGRFDWVVWLLERGYTHDLARARRGVASRVGVPDQQRWKSKALEMIDQRLAADSGVTK